REELAGPLRSVVVAVSTLERRDVGTDQPRLAAVDPGVGVGQIRLAGPERLDLRPGQDDAGLERLVDRVVVAGSSVECDGRLVAHARLLCTMGYFIRTNDGPIRGRVPG